MAIEVSLSRVPAEISRYNRPKGRKQNGQVVLQRQTIVEVKLEGKFRKLIRV